MADPFRHVRAGEELTFSATVENALRDAARAAQDRRLNKNLDVAAQFRRADLVLVKNETGGDLGRNRVVGLGAPIFTPAVDLDAFLREVAFRGVVPGAGHLGRFGVLLEPAAAGSLARAYVAGVCAVRVVVASTSHTRADAAAGSTAALASSTTGSALILWSVGGTGEQWALVRLGITCGAT